MYSPMNVGAYYAPVMIDLNLLQCLRLCINAVFLYYDNLMTWLRAIKSRGSVSLKSSEKGGRGGGGLVSLGCI